jgi:hypothetical protein
VAAPAACLAQLHTRCLPACLPADADGEEGEDGSEEEDDEEDDEDDDAELVDEEGISASDMQGLIAADKKRKR